MSWHSGPHFAATPEPWSYVLCDLNADGVHASCFNKVSYGIEMVGDYRKGGDLFDPAVRDAAVNILAALHCRFGWDPDSYIYGVRGLHFHCECKADNHACPGDEVSKTDIITRILQRMSEIKATKIAMPTSLPPSVLPQAETPMLPTIVLPAWPAESDAPGFFAAARALFDKFKALGASNPTALAILAQAEAESSLNPKAVGDKGTAHGLWQWHSDRCAQIKAATGIDVCTAGLEDQATAAWWELTKGQERPAFAKFSTAETALEAGQLACTLWERAGAPIAAQKRGALAERWADYFSK